MTPLPPHPTPNPVVEPTALKRWTVHDYHRMGELGLLDPNERTELIAGHITLMAPKGAPHVTALHLLAHALREPFKDTALIRTQDPIQLDICGREYVFSAVLNKRKPMLFLVPSVSLGMPTEALPRP